MDRQCDRRKDGRREMRMAFIAIAPSNDAREKLYSSIRNVQKIDLFLCNLSAVAVSLYQEFITEHRLRQPSTVYISKP